MPQDECPEKRNEPIMPRREVKGWDFLEKVV